MASTRSTRCGTLRVMSDVVLRLRVLASPGSVLSLVVLVVNDHVLKQAWPGLVTGKLSDVAGLVFAPLLLQVALAALRVPRPLVVSLVATGVGFLMTKSTPAGAAAVSDLWSLTGVPTVIHADRTDLLALPALLLAGWVHRSVAARLRLESAPGWRRTLALAVGTAMLPCGVLASSATSCGESEGITRVALVEGDFPGEPAAPEQRIALGAYGVQFTLDATGTYAEPQVELAGDLETQTQTCVARQCWRLLGADAVQVEESADGGRTWAPAYELDERERQAVRQRVDDGDDGCDGEPPVVRAGDVAALATDAEPLVVVPLGQGGILARQQDGVWRLLLPQDLSALAVQEAVDLPAVTPLDQSGAPTDGPTDEPTSPSTTDRRPTCTDPSPVTITPNPGNGPPTTYEVCV